MPILRAGDQGLRRLGVLMGPRILILAMFQLVFLFTTNLASRLEKGSITAINMGWIMVQLPEVIFAMAIATAAFPAMSQEAARGDRAALASTVSGSLRAILFLTLPSAVALLLLGRSYIAVLFRSGAFDSRAVVMVYQATAAFTVGLLGHSVLELAARIFYAHMDTVTPFFLALGASILNLALCLALSPWLGQAGLALANSIAVTVQSSVLLWLGWRSKVRFRWRPVWALAWHGLVAAAAMCGGIVLVNLQRERLGDLWVALLGSAVGGVIYLGLMALLSRDELRFLAGPLLRRIDRRAK
jgi:putative peptidoglycan lipid II flippase